MTFNNMVSRLVNKDSVRMNTPMVNKYMRNGNICTIKSMDILGKIKNKEYMDNEVLNENVNTVEYSR